MMEMDMDAAKFAATHTKAQTCPHQWIFLLLARGWQRNYKIGNTFIDQLASFSDHRSICVWLFDFIKLKFSYF
jgi:hypothetical protein